MTVKDVVQYLESLAPPALQESYDNAGLITGSLDQAVSGAVLCLDSTEAVVDEAILKNCNLVIAHHPLIFKGLKSLTGANYVERTIIKAIKHNIAIYAVHTNLDNVPNGVNKMICNRLELMDTRILEPQKTGLKKMVTFVPKAHADTVRQAIFNAGAGHIGQYDECSFNVTGTGTFRGSEGSNPFVGEEGKQHHETETRIEVIYPFYKEKNIIQVLLKEHPYEEVAYDLYALDNKNPMVGAGMIGRLKEPMTGLQFLEFIKQKLKTDCIRHTALLEKPVGKVAVCGGAGSFLLPSALRCNADFFITGDFKYHEFFDAESRIVIADVGHYESEQFTINWFYDVLSEKFTTFALHLTEVNTNPIKYYY
jgi:dinuclear metal center YbgI/SA1388 family protein